MFRPIWLIHQSSLFFVHLSRSCSQCNTRPRSIHYILFTFMYLADAFSQSNLYSTCKYNAFQKTCNLKNSVSYTQEIKNEWERDKSINRNDFILHSCHVSFIVMVGVIGYQLQLFLKFAEWPQRSLFHKNIRTQCTSLIIFAN